MAPPRTLVAFHLAETSGPFRDLELELGWLAQDGSLEVVVPGPGPVAESFGGLAPVTEIDYSALTLPEGPAAIARALGRAAREVRAFRAHLRDTRPDLVVVATTTLPAAVIAARLERIPAIVYVTEIFAGERAARSSRGTAAGTALIGLSSRLAAAIVTCSQAVARQFAHRRAGVTTVYPPIPDAYAGGDGDAFRANHGIGIDDPCVAVVGNVTRGRGQDVMIRALRRIREALPSARCAIVGSPFRRRKDLAFEGELRRLAADLGLGDAVAFTGFCDQVADAYAAADVVVNPARIPESFGRACCEALAAGRPVVATRVGALPEVLRDGRTALLTPAEDPDALAAAVVRLLRDRGLAARLAAAGREDALERFSPERSRRAFAQVLDTVAARGRDPGPHRIP